MTSPALLTAPLKAKKPWRSLAEVQLRGRSLTTVVQLTGEENEMAGRDGERPMLPCCASLGNNTHPHEQYEWSVVP